MNTIFDVYKALSKNKNSAQVGLVYDPATDSLSFKKDGRIFTACIDGGRLSVCIIDGREHYIYFERLRELFCLLNGIVKGGLEISKISETTLKINGRPLKEFRKTNIALGIFSMLIAAALMIFSVCLIIGYVFSDFSGTYNTLTNFAMLPFCIGIFICGIRLAVYAVKQRGYKKVIGTELFGTAVGWFSLTLLAINWAEYYKQPDQNLSNCIGASVLFLFMTAFGVFMSEFPAFAKRQRNFSCMVKRRLNFPSANDLLRIIDAMEKKTSAFEISAKVDENRVPSIFDSKVGGVPYWDGSKQPPCAAGGERLVFLAQIDLSQLPVIPESDSLPKRGILQFFASDDLYSEEKTAVIYHENPDRTMTEQQAAAFYGKNGKVGEDITFVTADRMRAMSFIKKPLTFNPSDPDLNGNILNAAKSLGIYLDPDMIFSEFIEACGECGIADRITGASAQMKLFGFPYINVPSGSRLLFQFECTYFLDPEVYFDFEPCVCFFIDDKSLSERKFENAKAKAVDLSYGC
ncbi:MAG: DUF1963 domain-containing protein [Oscillospiraceae bacterium]